MDSNIGIVSDAKKKRTRNPAPAIQSPRSPASGEKYEYDLIQANLALKRVERLYLAMVSVEAILLREDDEGRLFQGICDELLNTELFTSVGIILPNKAGRLRFYYMAGAGVEVVSRIQQEASTADQTLLLAEMAYRQGTPRFSNDVNNDPHYVNAHGYMQAYLHAQTFLSIALLPIYHDKKPYAILSLGGREAGLFDVMMQDLGLRLIGLITFALDNLRLKQQVKAEHANRIYLSCHDGLTDLLNRSALLNKIPEAMARAQRSKRLMAVCMIDLDDFKPVNDTYGHVVGDRVLQGIANSLCMAVREIDTIARLGGDEFVLLLEGIDCMDDLNQVMDRISDALAKPIALLDEVAVSLGGSIGVTLYPLDDVDADILLRHANHALYGQKRTKKHNPQRWGLYCDENFADTGHKHYQTLFQEGYLKVFYQPVLDNLSKKIVGIEALARLEDQNGRIISPAQFLPELCVDDLIALSHQVLQQSLADLSALDALGISLWVSFNVDPVSLSMGCLDCLRDTIGGSGIDPRRVIMEILESGDFLNRPSTMDIIYGIKSLGVRIALDDVGSAYASLLRIKELPVDEIKLDQGFVRTLDQEPENIQFVQSMCDLAEGLGVNLVVEGVENDAILDIVTVIGAPLLQGYGISHPLPFAALKDFLQQPVTCRQHPVGLMGVYAAQISNYSALKKIMRQQPDIIDHATIARADLCPIHDDLRRLGVAADSDICVLHQAFHQAVAARHLVAIEKSGVANWSATDRAHADFIRAIWEEYKRHSMKMHKYPAQNQTGQLLA